MDNTCFLFCKLRTGIPHMEILTKVKPVGIIFSVFGLISHTSAHIYA